MSQNTIMVILTVAPPGLVLLAALFWPEGGGDKDDASHDGPGKVERW